MSSLERDNLMFATGKLSALRELIAVDNKAAASVIDDVLYIIEGIITNGQ